MADTTARAIFKRPVKKLETAGYLFSPSNLSEKSEGFIPLVVLGFISGRGDYPLRGGYRAHR